MCYVIKSTKSILVTEDKGDTTPLFTGSRRECMDWAAQYWASKRKPVQESVPMDASAELQRQLDSFKAQWLQQVERSRAVHRTLLTARKGSEEWKGAMATLELMAGLV